MKMKIDTAEQNFLNGISMIEDLENILDDLDFPMEADVDVQVVGEDWDATAYGPLFGPIPDTLLSLRQNCLDDDMTNAPSSTPNEFPEAQGNALLQTQSPISLDIGSKGRRSKRTRPSTLNPWLLMDPIPCADKKHSDAKRGTENVSGPMGSSLFKRCTHCEVTKTPQWREGPLGPKTLCNACGVRYRSGRLLPEYRPAASPTFIPSLHSNSHRKVLEMRTKFAPLHSYLFNGYC